MEKAAKESQEGGSVVTSQPQKRRRWRRWVVGLLVMVVIGCGWSLWHSASLISRTKQLRLGMTESESLEIMGPPHISTSSRSENGMVRRHYYGVAMSKVLSSTRQLLSNLTGQTIDSLTESDRQVELRIGPRGSLVQIRHGS
jgi:hypothetical protein